MSDVGLDPRRAAWLTLVAVWSELVLALTISSEPQPGLMAFPLLVAGGGLLLGGDAALALGLVSGVAIPIAYEAGKLRLTGSGALSAHEITWLVAAEICTIGISLMTRAALASYGALLDKSERARARLVALFELAPDGLVELDRQDQIVEANAAARRLLGESPVALEGSGFASALTRAGVTGPLDLARARPGAPLVLERDG